MQRDVRDWLAEQGLDEYAAAFEENAVTLDLVPTLTADDLRDLGIAKIGHRRRLLNAAGALLVPVPAPAEPSGAALVDQAERRQLSILVCDIVGSTELARELGPEEMRGLVGAFQEHCATTIRRLGGCLGPFLGDAVIAWFGFPQTLENDAESALRAGLSIVRGLRSAPGLAHPLDVRVGIATGLCVVGRLNQGLTGEPTVIGDAPSLAVRLQGHARPNTVVCGGVTRRLAGELFRFEPLGQVAAKGFDGPVAIWEVQGENDLQSRFKATRAATIARLIGRTHERALLDERWATAARGEGQAVVITGSPGIGKSRLARSLADAIDRERHRVLAFQCSPLFAQSPLYPVVRHLEAAAGVVPAEPQPVRLAKLESLLQQNGADPRLLDDLAPLLLDPGQKPRAEPERLRADTFAALVRLLTALRGGRPTLLLVEDIHWIDPSTRELLQQILAGVAREPLLIVMTARPEAELRWTQAADPLVIQLAKLNRTQSAEFLAEIFQDRVISIPIARRLIDRTDGVPLFIEEVCRGLIEAGSLQADANQRIDPDAVLGFVPATLHDTLLSRLDRHPQGKLVAQVAAVIGREFRIELLRAIWTLGEDELQAGLDSLLAADLVHPVADTAPGFYAFKHGLMHQAAYETLLLRHREALHLRICERLPEVLPEFVRARPEILARHLSLAGEPARAAEQWLWAAGRALERGAYEEGCQHLRAGLAAVGQLEAGPERDARELPLQIALAQALRAARFTSGDEALDAARRARSLAERQARPSELLRVLRLEFGIQFNRPDITAAESTARAFTSAPLIAASAEAQALGHQALGKVRFFQGRFGEAGEAIRTALRHLDGAPAPELLAHHQYPVSGMVYLAGAELCLGRIEASREIAERAVAISRDGTEFTRSLTLANLLILELVQRGSPRTAAMLDELRGIAIARGAPFWVALVAFHDGWHDVQEGRAAAGIARMRDALVTFREHSVEVEMPFYQAVLAEALIDQGELDDAALVLDDARARIARTGERWPEAEVLRLAARLAGARGEAGEARGLLDRATAIAAAQEAGLWRERITATAAALGLERPPGAARAA